MVQPFHLSHGANLYHVAPFQFPSRNAGWGRKPNWTVRLVHDWSLSPPIQIARHVVGPSVPPDLEIASSSRDGMVLEYVFLVGGLHNPELVSFYP